MINIKKNENYNKSCDCTLASVYRRAFGYHVPWTLLPPQSNRQRAAMGIIITEVHLKYTQSF